MSTEAATPTPEQAYDRVMETVYHPVFFDKLASYGVVPANTREAEQLLYLGNQMFARHRQALAKEAEKRGSFLDFACARLDSSHADAGGLTDGQVKQAAANVLADPTFAAAATTLARVLAAGA